MGSNLNSILKIIAKMFSNLANYNIYAPESVRKKIAKLVMHDVDNFVIEFYKAMKERNFEYKKFEILNLTKEQKSLLDNNILMRYEYRRGSNLRVLFVLINKRDFYNDRPIVVLDAFNENGNKTKGKDSYDKAIKNAIQTYLDCKEDEDEI